MANQSINLGIGTTGADTLYNGAVKINSNFLEIYSTFGDGTSLVSYANTSGVSTTSTTSTNVIGGIGSIAQLQVTGVSTFTNGPVLIGSATSTGTINQDLQVNGGAYFSDNVGIGTTNPFGSSIYSGLDVNRTNVKIYARNIGTATDAAVWAADQDYFSTPSYKGVGILKYGPGTTGTILSSIPYADTGVLSFQNNTNALIYTNGQSPLIVATNSTERARFDGLTGNLGIGTINPTSALTVQGDVKVSGGVTATSFTGSGTKLTGIVTSIIAGTGVTVSGSTGQVTINQNYQYYRLNSNYVGNTATTAQPIFGVGVALTSSTTYEFELGFTIQKTSGGTSHNFQFGFGGTYSDGGTSAAANSYMQMSYVVLDGATAVGSTSNLWSTNSIGGAYNIFTASTVANRLLHMNVRGTISVGSTGGGTFIPQYTLSANPGAAYSTRTGSWMKISPLGASGSNISIGNWA